MPTLTPLWIKEIIENDSYIKNLNCLVNKGEVVYIPKFSSNLEKFNVADFKTKCNDKPKNIRVVFFRDGPFLPITTGAANSIFGMMNALADKNIEVSLLHSFRGWSDPMLFKNQKFNSMFVNPEDFYGNKYFISSLLKAIEVDICHFDSAEAVCMQSKLLPKNCKTVFEVHNVENELISQLNADGAEKIKKIEMKAVKCADAVIVRSESNYLSMLKLGCDKKRLFKYRGGINADKINFIKRDKLFLKKILFLGHLNYGPNQQAVDVIARLIAPFVKKTFLIAGKGAPNLKEKYNLDNLQFLGWIDDLDKLFAETDIALAPIVTGSGTRIKILDYMAAGIPVIGSTMAIDGLEPEIENCMIVENNFNKYKDIIEWLYSDTKKVGDLSRKGREYVMKYRNWCNCIGDVIKAYLFALDDKNDSNK